MKVLIIDNFDSFTYNLYQCVGELAPSVEVVRNDVIPFERLQSGVFSHVIISPGPGNPTDPAYFGGNTRLIATYYDKLPLLGICLGHQGLGAYFGAEVVRAPVIMHGKTSAVCHTAQGLFRGLAPEITAMRYHSLVLAPDSLPPTLIVDARTENGVIMGFHHERYPSFGLQFHPESFATPAGKQLLTNFLHSSQV